MWGLAKPALLFVPAVALVTAVGAVAVLSVGDEPEAWTSGAAGPAVVCAQPGAAVDASIELRTPRPEGRRVALAPGEESSAGDEERRINDVIGVGGGGAGGSYRFVSRCKRRRTVSTRCGWSSKPSREAVHRRDRSVTTRAGGRSGERSWLSQLQREDGSWPAQGRLGEVGATALALLALTGDGNTTLSGPERHALCEGLEWLRRQQDAETGLFEGALGPAPMSDHALATMAFADAYYMVSNPILRGVLRRALPAVESARTGDVFTTGWQVLAARSAESADIGGDRSELYRYAIGLFEAASDPETGATLGSARLTAMTRLCRLSLGETSRARPDVEGAARWLAEAPFGSDPMVWVLGACSLQLHLGPCLIGAAD